MLALEIWVAHEFPHFPQCFASVDVVTHIPLHTVCDEGQETAQVPFSQAEPAGHIDPHEPQLNLSV